MYGYSALATIQNPSEQLGRLVAEEELPGSYEHEGGVTIPLQRENGEGWYWSPKERIRTAFAIPDIVLEQVEVDYYLQSEEVGSRNLFASIPTSVEGLPLVPYFTNAKSMMEEDWHSTTSYVARQMARLSYQAHSGEIEELGVDMAEATVCKKGQLIVTGKQLGSLLAPVGDTDTRLASNPAMAKWTDALQALRARQQCSGCDLPHYSLSES